MNGPTALRSADTPYRGRLIAVGTRHGKQHQFAPAFRSLLGADLLTPPDLDTDRFGAFTGEVARRGSAAQAARAKARLAMEVTGLPFGLASEASYGALPGGWFGHEEIVVFCDDALGFEVLEGHRSASVPGVRQRVSRLDDLLDQLLAGLPEQALTVRPDGAASAAAVVKGITDTAAMHSAITAAVAASPEGLAVVEPDLRAHCNPSRRKVLRRLAARLASRLATECPACAAPGFGRVDAEPGLPCRDCDTPTPLVRAQIHACAVCPHQLTRPVAGDADPAVCPSCNP
jgi:hypothetical protein